MNPGSASLLRALRSRLRPIVLTALIALVIVCLARVGLMWWLAARVSATHGWTTILLSGVRVDLATLGLLFGLPAVLAVLLPQAGLVGRVVSGLLRVWLTAALLLVLQLELATPAFMDEYGVRPNRMFLEYLIYPKEVVRTLLLGHTLAVVVSLVVMAAVAWWAWRWIGRTLRTSESRIGILWRVPCAVLLLLLSVFAVRSTVTGHRPLNPAMVAFSTDPTINQLPMNSTFALLHAAREWVNEEDGAQIYGSMPWPEIVQEVRGSTGLPIQAFKDPHYPTLAARPPVHTGKPRNVVIILEESLGAQFVGSLGGLPLTPNIDALGREGWAFQRLYATGTRSVRGIEAVVSGFTPTPAQAVVKLPKSQTNFYSLARTFARHGYDTTFYYGGEGHFDNMRGFFLGNGFKRIVEQKDFHNPDFVGSWGVSDEDLMRRADAEFRGLHQRGTPFFGLVFSSSNHDPFEYPDGRITLYEQPKQTRNNAAKYADHAIGEFFKLAKKSPYWKDTVFLIVADHDSRVFGKDLVPIRNFHIPGVILGDGIAPRQDARIISQIDLPVTLLSLAGIGDATPMLGQDLNQPNALRPGRAMMQYDRNLALMQGDDVVILTPGKPASAYTWNDALGQLVPAPAKPELARRALAIALWGSASYDKQLYQDGAR